MKAKITVISNKVVAARGRDRQVRVSHHLLINGDQPCNLRCFSSNKSQLLRRILPHNFFIDTFLLKASFLKNVVVEIVILFFIIEFCHSGR